MCIDQEICGTFYDGCVGSRSGGSFICEYV